jgi:anti-sigma B factor antagonist
MMPRGFEHSQAIDTLSAIEVIGRFDAHMAPQVSAQLDERLKAGQKTIVVDLSKAHFVDSTALSTLVRGMKRAREQGGDLILSGLQQPVRIIFELTRMDKAFTIVDSPSEAPPAYAEEIQA